MKRQSTNQFQGKPTKRLALPRTLVASPFVPPRQFRVPAARALGEKKGMDTAISFAQINSTVNDNSGMIVLNLIQQGAGSWNRVGRKVNLRSLRIRGDIIHTQTTGVATGLTNGQTVRCVIVWDKQPSSGSSPNTSVFGTLCLASGDGKTALNCFVSIKHVFNVRLESQDAIVS